MRAQPVTPATPWRAFGAVTFVDVEAVARGASLLVATAVVLDAVGLREVDLDDEVERLVAALAERADRPADDAARELAAASPVTVTPSGRVSQTLTSCAAALLVFETRSL